jgi:hypothetical protein
MSEENQKPDWHTQIAKDLTDPAFQHMDWNGRTTDWFLQEQVKLANNLNFSMSITLFTAAGMVTGQLISVEEYFKLYAESFSAAFAEQERDNIREAYEAKGKLGTPPKENEPEPSPQFIHLKGAKLCALSGQIPGNPGFLWRGTIASISGFALGSLSS